MGVVSELKADTRQVIVTTAAGSQVTVTLSDRTVFMRIPPGEKTKDKFIKIAPTDFTVGDSVFARGRMSEDRKNLPALEFYVMSKGDIAEKKERERDEWTKRGIAGTISAINAENKEISVDSRTPAGPKPVVIATNGETKFRRYAPDSVRFNDAKPGTFADLKIGDQLRAATLLRVGSRWHQRRRWSRGESSAKFNDYRWFGGLRRQMSKGFSVFANFGGGRGKTDTDCIFGMIANCFPADSYDASAEYSRVSFIPTRSFFAGGTMILPKLKVNFNPFIVYQAGRPFNIITGRDKNGDGLFTERPAFATALTASANLRETSFGNFDSSPAPGQALIPRNYGLGPSFFSVNMGISRAFQFGNVSGSAAAAAKPAAAPPAGAPAQGGANRQGNAPAAEKRYTLTLSVNIQNLLNHTNLTNPIGNLSSPDFGKSISTAGGFGGPGGSSAAGNRRIQVQVRLGF